ncbi:hypothetical protein PFISCL1PPCAC_15422 [Pristionchus fissidentatus]|uniref:Uncharacterized protein n=1 Tax=Pristionchus fissidentatus TaxID=1538716 RepID=A0AAV5VX55_9BILA|nr:hypothetical protein PFISCL1PPCAC_15422 [Pristionchus fissidentatus]
MESVTNGEVQKTPKPLSTDELSMVGKSNKPNFSALPPSSLLGRLMNFIPQLETANANIEEGAEVGVGIDIERVVDSSSESDSDSDSHESSSDDEEMEEKSTDPTIEITVAIINECLSVQEGSRMEEEAEKSLPEAFRDDREEVKQSPKKKLIEEV